MDMKHEFPKDLASSVKRSWIERIFKAKAVKKGGVVRRAVADVEKFASRDALQGFVEDKGFHLIECGGQFIVICNCGTLKVHT